MCIAHAPAEKGIRERGSGIWWMANETDQGLSQKALTYGHEIYVFLEGVFLLGEQYWWVIFHYLRIYNLIIKW